MRISLNFRRQAAEGTTDPAPVSADSRMDRWARARGAALVESVVVATHRGA